MTCWNWVPPVMLAIGIAFTLARDGQEAMPLRQPLGVAVPAQMGEFSGKDLELSEDVREVVGVSSYLLRDYRSASPQAAAGFFSVYIGYYEQQSQGETIHSPRNCLPGGGWEPLESAPVRVQTPEGTVVVNQYVLQKGRHRALVLYWYQGRGRVEANEYAVKRDLLLDAALKGRSEEALVRIVVPILGDDQHSAGRLAAQVATLLVPATASALPL